MSCYCALVLSSLAASFGTLSSHLFLAFWGASSCETSFHNLFVHSVIKHPYYLHSPLMFFNTFIFYKYVQLYIVPYFPDAITLYWFKYYPKDFYFKETSFVWQSGNVTTFYSHRTIGQMGVLSTLTLLSWLTSSFNWRQ